MVVETRKKSAVVLTTQKQGTDFPQISLGKFSLIQMDRPSRRNILLAGSNDTQGIRTIFYEFSQSATSQLNYWVQTVLIIVLYMKNAIHSIKYNPLRSCLWDCIGNVVEKDLSYRFGIGSGIYSNNNTSFMAEFHITTLKQSPLWPSPT